MDHVKKSLKPHQANVAAFENGIFSVWRWGSVLGLTRCGVRTAGGFWVQGFRAQHWRTVGGWRETNWTWFGHTCCRAWYALNVRGRKASELIEVVSVDFQQSTTWWHSPQPNWKQSQLNDITAENMQSWLKMCAGRAESQWCAVRMLWLVCVWDSVH